MYDPTLVDLLLIGKTGNGKSAAGNSILRRNAFESKDSMSSVTLEIAYEVSLCNSRVVKVVDGPGVGDTRMNREEAVNSYLKKMEYAIAANPRGYHAFCLVLKYGGRFTGEEKDTINFLKTTFGEGFVKKFCILVMTYGDCFEKASEESGQTFEDWYNEQEGDFKDLLNECDNRIVLFDNKTKDETKKKDQVTKLLKIVENLSSHGERYTDENFQKALKAQKQIIRESQTPMIKEKIMAETSLILQQLQNIQLEEDPDENIKLLEKLLNRVKVLKSPTTSKDRGTGALHALKPVVNSIERSVEDKIKFCNKLKQKQENIRHEEETKRKYEDEMKKQREEFEKQPKGDARPVEDHRKFEQEIKEREEKEQKMRAVLEEFQKKTKEFQTKTEKLQKSCNEKIVKRQRTQEQECQTLETEYKKVKTENDKGIFEKVVNAVSWPFRQITSWFNKK